MLFVTDIKQMIHDMVHYSEQKTLKHTHGFILDLLWQHFEIMSENTAFDSLSFQPFMHQQPLIFLCKDIMDNGNNGHFKETIVIGDDSWL